MNNMQLWQQQLMYKQLQEIRRQQQLQQPDEGARQLSGLNQLSAVAKPATGNHSSAALNDVPLNDVYNFTRQNSFVGGTPNVPPNPQIFTSGNMNWMHSAPMHNLANGVFISNDQSEALRSIGFMSQPNNQTFQGIPVSDTSSINQYPHILGMANNRHDLMSKADPTNSEKVSYLSKSFQSDEHWAAQGILQGKTLTTTQDSQGKHLFGSSQVQVLGNNAMAGNFQEENNLQHNVQFQETHGRYEQDDSSNSLHGKPESQIGSSTLDPIEQKILFGTDDDNWGFSFGASLISETGGDMHGHFSENDCSGVYPSVNSGSWSALMQEAVQSSSSDKGLQEEWSGLQKSEPLDTRIAVSSNDNGKNPASWDNKNPHSTSLLTSTPFPLFNDDNATARSSITPQHSFKSAHEDENRFIKASHVSSSFQGASNSDFQQDANQSQLAEDGLQEQLPSTSRVWAARGIERHNKRPSDIQFKSQNMEGGWDNQPNFPFPNISIQSGNRPNGWKTSYPMEFRGSNTSNIHENDGNLWKAGEEHAILNNGSQPNKSYIGSPKMQEDSALAGKFGSIRNTNNLSMNQNMHQQLINTPQPNSGRHSAVGPCVNSEGGQNVEVKLNQPSRRPQTWEPSARTTGESSGNSHDNGTVCGRAVSGKDYLGNTAKELMLAGNNQYPSVSGNQKSSIQSVQHPVRSKLLQNPLGDFRNVGPSFPPNYQSRLQDLSNSMFQELNNEQKLFGKTQFTGHNVSNESMIASKGTAVQTEEMQSRNNVPIYASSSSFDGPASQYSNNEMIRQDSNNMLELLHKVDQSRNGNSLNSSDLPGQSVAEISIAHPQLRLAPPSQRQSLSNYAPIPSKSVSDINNIQMDYEAGYQGQPQASGAPAAHLVSSLNEASRTGNRDKISNLSGQKHKEHHDSNDNYIFNSSTAASNFHVEEQRQQSLQQHIASANDHLLQQPQQHRRQHQHFPDMVSHEAVDQSIKISIGNQGNESRNDKNASTSKQPRDSHNEAVPGQSVQMSLPTLVGRFPTSGADSFGATPVPAGLQTSSGGKDDRELTIPGFPQITKSVQQLPVMETCSASQSSISGMSQQVAFSKMLHNVWTNISARQGQAGVNPQMLTPTILQSILNSGRNKSLWGMLKAGEQVNKEGSATPEGAGAVNSQKEENPVQGNPSNLIVNKKVNATDSSLSAPHGEEGDLKPPLDVGSCFSVFSLVHQHQQDVNKAKLGRDPAFSSPVHAPFSSSSSDVGISGCMSKPSDAQQQNYSLLHQVQAIKASDYDANRMVRNIPNAVGSNATQMNYNRDQRFDNHQNRVFRTPDGKVGMTSQVSFPSDAKVLAFVSSGADERNPSTSRFGLHDLQTNMHPLSIVSTANMMGGSEHIQSSPQMAPSWFEHYGAYQNDRMVAIHDAQRNEKASIQQYLSQNIPASMDDNSLMVQRDSGQIGSYRPGILGSKATPSELSTSLLPSGIMDHDMIIRSKKRKTTRDLPWHEVVAGPQSLLCISMSELDWAQAVNRLIEKVDDEAEFMEDGLLVPQSRRRLILTTQLMHQLLTAVPAVMFKGEATSSYEGMTFSVARSTLADACSLVCSSESDSHVSPENGKTKTCDKLKSSKTSKLMDDPFSKLTEDFIGRSKKLELDFSRLDKKTSMLDVRLECQELERFSIVNRLGKFHGRTHADGVDASSNPENAHHRIFVQRYITALPVPGNLPEGVLCLSL